MEAVPADKKFAIIQEMAGCHGSIQQLCEMAGVSRSGYYKWVKRQERPSQKQVEDERRGVLSRTKRHLWVSESQSLA